MLGGKKQMLEIPDDLKILRQSALNALARREYSYFELQQKLLKKINNPAAISTVLEKLIQENLLNDARYAEAFCRMKINRGYGPLRIQMELRDRGIKDELIKNIIYSEEIDWEELATHARKKRFGNSIPKDLNDRAKQMRFLQYRGFTHDQIKAAFRNCSTIE